MKKILIISMSLLLAVMVFSSSHAYAQYTWIDIHGSALFPTGSFDHKADDGFGGGIGIGTYVNPNVVLKATLSYHGFGVRTVLGEEIDGSYIPLEVGGNFYLGYPGFVRPYLTAHGGWFVAGGDFEDSAFGLGGGLGMEFSLGDPTTKLFIEPNYNIVFQDNEDEEYWGINVGISFSLSAPSFQDRSQPRSHDRTRPRR